MTRVLWMNAFTSGCEPATTGDGCVQVEVKKGNANYLLLTVAACIPYALTFLSCVGKALFGNYRKPSFGTWLWVGHVSCARLEWL